MKKIIALSALMAALASANAMAVDANLTFTGNVTSGTCVLSSSDATKSIIIPDVSSAALMSSSTSWYTQSGSSSFGFSSCPASVSKITPTITSSNPMLNGSSINGLTSDSGVIMGIAMGAGVGSYSTWSVADGSSSAGDFAVTSGAANIPFQIGIYATINVDSTYPAPSIGTYTNTYTVTFAYS